MKFESSGGNPKCNLCLQKHSQNGNLYLSQSLPKSGQKMSVHTHMHLSIHICICPYTYASVHTHMHLSIHICVCPYTYASVHTHMHLSIHICVCPYTYASVHTHMHLSIHICICPYTYASVHTHMHLSIHICICPYTYASVHTHMHDFWNLTIQDTNSTYISHIDRFVLFRPHETTQLFYELANLYEFGQIDLYNFFFFIYILNNFIKWGKSWFFYLFFIFHSGWLNINLIDHILKYCVCGREWL